MRLRWTTPAATDPYNIVQNIQDDNASAAAKVAAVPCEDRGSLGDFPRFGRKGRIEGTPELVSPGLPCLVVYRIQYQIAEIMRMHRVAQNCP